MAKAKKLSSGNWRCKANFTDEQGNYTAKSFTAETKKEAEYAAAQFLMEMKYRQKHANRTVGELLDEYLDRRTNLLSPTTMCAYRSLNLTIVTIVIDVRLVHM